MKTVIALRYVYFINAKIIYITAVDAVLDLMVVLAGSE